MAAQSAAVPLGLSTSCASTPSGVRIMPRNTMRSAFHPRKTGNRGCGRNRSSDRNKRPARQLAPFRFPGGRSWASMIDGVRGIADAALDADGATGRGPAESVRRAGVGDHVMQPEPAARPAWASSVAADLAFHMSLPRPGSGRMPRNITTSTSGRRLRISHLAAQRRRGHDRPVRQSLEPWQMHGR